jgi:hypothetical protein
MALWRDATAGALGPGQGDYDPYGDLSSLVRQIAPGIGSAAQTALQPQLSRPDDSFAAYMADPLARTDADIQQRAAAGPPSAGQSLADLGSLVAPYLAGGAPGGSLSSGIRAWHASPYDFDKFDISKVGTGCSDIRSWDICRRKPESKRPGRVLRSGVYREEPW